MLHKLYYFLLEVNNIEAILRAVDIVQQKYFYSF